MVIEPSKIGRILADAAKRQRGHADFFDWPDKSTKEWGVAQCFFEELEHEAIVNIVGGKPHPGGENHAPDFEFTLDNGQNWGIEITELVSQEAIEATKKGKSAAEFWSDDDLLRRFQERVATKDRSSTVRGGPYDKYVLLIHTDEDSVSLDRLDRVISSCSLQTQLIDDVYVLLSYDPVIGRQPLLHVAGFKEGRPKTVKRSE